MPNTWLALNNDNQMLAIRRGFWQWSRMLIITCSSYTTSGNNCNLQWWFTLNPSWVHEMDSFKWTGLLNRISANGKWVLILSYMCGSSGVHEITDTMRYAVCLYVLSFGPAFTELCSLVILWNVPLGSYLYCNPWNSSFRAVVWQFWSIAWAYKMLPRLVILYFFVLIFIECLQAQKIDAFGAIAVPIYC